MKTLRTRTCSKHDHPEFVLHHSEDIPGGWLQHFRGTLEQMVANGQVFRHGQTLQAGWMTTRVEAEENDLLTLLEPDMASMPIEWVRSIDRTVLAMGTQKSVVESVGLLEQILVPTLGDSIIVCDRSAEAATMFLMRSPPEGTDSGWFMSCVDPEHGHGNPDHLNRMSLYEAVLAQGSILDYLALPPGTSVVIEEGRPVLLELDKKPLPIAAGSFLDRLRSR